MIRGPRPASVALLAAVVAAAFQPSWPARAQSLVSPTYTPEQAAAGRAAYAQSCASCHGQNLDDGQFAGPLKGGELRQKWGGRPAEEIFTYAQINGKQYIALTVGSGGPKAAP